jgi:hypothetical protein
LFQNLQLVLAESSLPSAVTPTESMTSFGFDESGLHSFFWLHFACYQESSVGQNPFINA